MTSRVKFWLGLATVVAWTGTLVGPVCGCQLQVPAKNGTGGAVLEWQFNRNGGGPLTLRGSNEMAVLNLGGTTLPSGANLNATIEWLEE